MIIKLKDILTIYISPDHNEKYHKRKLHMNSLLSNLKFTNVIHYKSNTNNYPFCLNDAYIDIFIKYQPPFLLLEDDIDCDIENFPYEIDIPDNTDAFYLGLSTGGGHKIQNYDDSDSSFLHVTDSILKIKNMLTTHSVLYFNQKYMMHIRNLLLLYPSYYNDVLISQIQNRYNVYTFNKYIFYQSKEFDGHEVQTRITINSNRIHNQLENNFSLCYVSAFLNFNNKDKLILENEYFQYFNKLVKLDLPIILFLDKSFLTYGNYLLNSYKNLRIIYIDKNDLLFDISLPLPKQRNISKDSKEYIQFMNNKIIFMERAMNSNLFNTDHYAWIDFRIFHIFNDYNYISNKLIELSTRNYTKSVYFPGSATYIKYELNCINWRFLGGFFILDKEHIVKLKEETLKIFSEINVFTWEVNIWSILEYNRIFDFGWYIGDHNNSILNVP
jgi:hypothetical protein